MRAFDLVSIGNPLWLKYEKKFPFNPDSEWEETGLTTSDCQTQWFTSFMSMGWQLAAEILAIAFMYTDTIVIRELVRNKAFKWNATGTCLIMSNICALFDFLYCFTAYNLNVWDSDPNEWMYNNRVVLYNWVIVPLSILIDMEITVTWIDLYDRTQKMSKSTSKYIKALRYGMRIIGLLFSFGLLIYISMGAYVNLFFGSFGPPCIAIIFVSIGGHLITKTLCPDRKDVANPNWKVAEAIRRGVFHCVGANLGQIALVVTMIYTMRHPTNGQWVMICVGAWHFLFMFRMWGWLQYLIYGSRKHLQKYASEGSSSYFGFSTIGLNKTLTTASSRMSSAVSSKSSAAPSTAE